MGEVLYKFLNGREATHVPGFRYRLRRLSELADLDLDDPEQRLVAQLQLHLLAP